MNNYAPPLQGTANNLAQYGRYGDSMLVHMNPAEVDGIASLSPTGRLTINPITGQPEAFLPFLAPLIGGWLGSAALTGAGAGILGSAGLSSAMAGAIGSGLASWAESGDIKEGLMSGLTGYGVGKALGALGVGGKAAAEGTKQAALDPGLWTDATQGLIESGAAAAADPAAASLYQETTKGLGGMGERLSLMKSQRGQLIPNLMQQSPLMATGEMGRSQLQATKEMEEGLADLGEDDEESLQRQYDILGGAWDQLAKDYPYPVQAYPRYAGGGQVQYFQAGGMPTLGPESAAARQASIRGSVFVPPPTVNEAGQPWRAGFDPEHNYFGNVIPPGGPPDIPDIRLPFPWEPQTYDPMDNIYGGEGPIGLNRPLGPGGSGFLSGDPQPRRGDYDAETGAIEYMKAMRGWRNAEGIQQPGSDRTGQEQARIMMGSLGMMVPPDTSPETGLASIPPSLLPNFSPNIGLTGTPSSVAPPVAAPIAPAISRRPRRSDYEKEGGAGEYRSDYRDWLASQNVASGYQGGRVLGMQEGGITDLPVEGQQAEMMPDPAMQVEMMPDPAMQQESQMVDELVQQTILAILGRVDDPDVIIDMFIDQFGQEAYLALREEVLNTVVPGAQTEGLIEGQGDGMSDEVMGMIGDQQQVATSPGEYIVPADVVSGIGNGSSNSGASQLDGMIDQIRQARTGTEVQPEEIIPEEFMPA
jgi:hypothetical protein